MAKVTSRMVAHILVAAAEAFGRRVEKYNLNHRSIHRGRSDFRERQNEVISVDFSNNVIIKI